MIGIVVATHGCMGIELVRSTELIVGKCERVEAVHFSAHESCEEITQKIKQAIDRVNDGDGVVVFVDLAGGSYCTISGAFLRDEHIEVLTGVNLPMVINFINHRDEGKLKDVAANACNAGIKGIVNLRERL